MNTEESIRADLGEVAKCFAELSGKAGEIANAASICTEAIRAGGKVMFCGNGGSAADAQHLAAELVGRYKLNRRAMAAVALTTDTSILTSVGNDYGFEEIFARQVEGIGRAGDVLIGISTSGNSANVIKAIEKAKELGIATVALTGLGGGRMATLADAVIAVPSSATNHIQEMHIAVGHMICGIVEKAMFGQ